ncbi:hypothetical protein FJ250_11280 [bacterium]|nr:hypothetical protein [bacterium]
MKTQRPLSALVTLLAFVALVGAAGAAAAAIVPITWLDQSPTAIGSPVPNGAVINVPGVGNVTVTYSLPAHWTHARADYAPYTAGSVTSGPDTYTWTNYEYFSTIFTAGALGPEFGTITYTFPGTLPAGSVFVGPIGLGATTSFGGGNSTTRVLQNGTYLGDYVGDPTFGASQYIGGPGTFTVLNSVTGAGGYNPWWNTHLAVVRVDDAVSSITVMQTQLRGDGIGVNIGFAVDQVVSEENTTWGGVKSLFR